VIISQNDINCLIFIKRPRNSEGGQRGRGSHRVEICAAKSRRPRPTRDCSARGGGREEGEEEKEEEEEGTELLHII
jgi:hypothetical protein